MTANGRPSWPWYRYEPGAFRDATILEGFTLLERGAYHELLDWQWFEGSVPIDNPKRLASILRVSRDEAAELAEVLACKFPGGANPKMANLRAESLETSEKLSAAGRAGQRAKQAKAKALAEAHPSALAQAEESREEERRGEGEITRTREAPPERPDSTAGLNLADVQAPEPDELDKAEKAVRTLVGLAMAKGVDLEGMDQGPPALALIQNAFLHVYEHGGTLSRPKLMQLLQRGASNAYGLPHYFEAVSVLTIDKGTTKLLDPNAPPPWKTDGKPAAPESSAADRRAKVGADLESERIGREQAIAEEERWNPTTTATEKTT